MKTLTSKNSQTGMTLVEIMISLIIGAFLIGGILQIFITSKQTYRMQENLSRMQENGRFAMDFISRDIRMADYWGCLGSGLASTTNILDAGDPDFDPAIHSFTVGSGISGTNGAAGANAALDLSDSITFKGAVDSGSAVVEAMPNTSADIKVVADTAPDQFDIVLISDCMTADIFEVTNDPSTGGGVDDQVLHNGGNVAEGPGNTAPGNLSTTYGLDARVYNIATTIYSIADGEGGQPALFRQIDGAAADELVEGIENMQILYGVDRDKGSLTETDRRPDYYVPEDQVVQVGPPVITMDNVVSIRVSLLVTSTDDNLASQPLAFTYNGATTTPTDRRIRRVFTSTIAVRNRLF